MVVHSRVLGASGLSVSAIGLGCMGMSEFYGKADAHACIRTIHRALDLGVTLLDTSPSFGTPASGESANEHVLGKALKGRRELAVVATKVGIVRRGRDRVVDNSAARIRRSADRSLARLGVDHIDLYYLYRRDPLVPIEDVIDAMTGLVREGKVRHLGLSEVNAETLRRASKVHPITSLQSEYSLVSRHLEDDILPVARELGIGVVAYAPLGRALLGGALSTSTEWSPNDLRRSHPRFLDRNYRHNIAVIDRIRGIAAEFGCTPAQLALAWLLAKGDDIVPIPSTSRDEHLAENVKAVDVVLSADQVARLEAAIRPGDVAGARNTPSSLALMES